jgi:hypothetical protein
VENDIETLATAMYVKIDDMLRDWPDLAPVRPAAGTPLTLSDAELLTMAVMSALLGFTSERRWLRYADKELAGMFPRTIGQSGWNKRVRKAFFLFIRVIRMLGYGHVAVERRRLGRGFHSGAVRLFPAPLTSGLASENSPSSAWPNSMSLGILVGHPP